MSAVLRLLAGLALAGGTLAFASLLTVQEREEFATLYAENYDLAGAFRVAASTIDLAGANGAAIGTDDTPVEVGTAKPTAQTAVTKGNWVYAVTLAESTRPASGKYRVEATMSGTSLGCVAIAQNTAEAGEESVVVRFDLGSALSESPLFFVKVTPLTTPCTTPLTFHEVTLKTVERSGNVYRFASADGATDNPAVAFARPNVLKLTLERTDTSTHNFAVFGSSNPLDSTPIASSEYVNGQRQTVTFQWNPSAAGTYEYRCELHPATMKGTLTVT